MQHSYAQNQGEFNARSGRTVRPQEDGSIRFGLGLGYLGRYEAMDAEEYFQAKRDAELGRWRDPLFPSYVVYRGSPDYIRVVDEFTGVMVGFYRSTFADSATTEAHVADHYFDAHPERKLPEENGVYIPGGVDLSAGPLTFVLYNGSWRTMPHSRDAEELAHTWHEKKGLVRLVKPEDAS